MQATDTFSISNNNETGNSSDVWAIDTVNRTITITKHGVANIGFCPSPPGNATCYLYDATVTENGTFVAVPGNASPNAGTPIAAAVDGTVTGGTDVQFYADSGDLSATYVPNTIINNGDAHLGTMTDPQWYEYFFPLGTVVTHVRLPDYNWVFSATSENCTLPDTQEQWTDAFGGETGDITGACVSPT